MAFQAMYGNLPETDVKADYREAVKFGTFRIGKEALYLPAFPTGAEYLPLAALDSAWIQKSTISPKGCCGGQFPVFVLRVRYGNELYQNLTLDKEQDANRALSLIKERRPDLPGAPEGKNSGSSIL